MPQKHKTTSLISIFDQAIMEYAPETVQLRYLPENRYNREIFPAVGQYDWLSGQLLYCLVRFLKPKRVIEVSTSTGYSSLFCALALKANNEGRLETFELSTDLASAAESNFKRFKVTEFVQLHIGDARTTSQTLISKRRKMMDKEILFLDSEHTEEFARFFLDAFLPDTHTESLFQMHDILPLHAKVTYRPSEKTRKLSLWLRAQGWMYNKFFRKILPQLGPFVSRRRIKPIIFDPSSSTSEASYGHQLSSELSVGSQVYIHDLINRYPELDGRRYDHTSIWRCNNQGEPMEWNNSWWVKCEELANIYLK